LSNWNYAARKLTYLSGFAGVAIILLTCWVAASGFRGPTGLPYSFLNRDISALGEPDLSALASLFNWGLRIGGACLVIFMLGLSRCVRHWGITLAVVCGIIAAIGVILVGVFPAPERAYHRAAASIVFFSGLATFVLFTATVLSAEQGKLARWLAIPSAIVTLAIGSFLVVPYYLYENPYVAFFVGPPGPDRPIVWLPSLLEWAAFFLVAAWVLIVSGYLYYQERTEKVKSPIRSSVQPSPQPWPGRPPAR
jgi:hypothetical membrane protein